MEDFEKLIQNTLVSSCLECGKCVSVCPKSQFGSKFSPRRFIRQGIKREREVLFRDERLFSCLACGACNPRCPQDVMMERFVQRLRIEAKARGNNGVCAHGGALLSMMRLIAKEETNSKPLDWLSDDLKIKEEGEYLYFVGCIPIFDRFFDELDLNLIEIPKSTVRILNYLGIEPVVLRSERCCGHDLLWTGDWDLYLRLRAKNIEIIKKSKAKKVITSCAECYITLKKEYSEGGLGFEVFHISQFLSQEIKKGSLKFKENHLRLTFHDPCRLGRQMNVYDAPRDVLQAIPGIELREMLQTRSRSLCCGTSSFINCGKDSKKIQLRRLRQAKDTGADTMIVSCPKCFIHFSCAIKDKDAEGLEIKIQDLSDIIAKNIKEE